MKTIYNALIERQKDNIESTIINIYGEWIERLKASGAESEQIGIVEELKEKAISESYLRWMDWDKGQLKKKGENDRYPVAFPCQLVRIGIISTSNLTDTIQDCKATVTITLAFDPLSYGRTAANAPEEVRSQGLEPYDIISKVYANLQGYYTNEFSPLTRKTAGELTHPDLFVYQIVFETEFEDNTAEK